MLGGALRDDSKNGCVTDYVATGGSRVPIPQILARHIPVPVFLSFWIIDCDELRTTSRNAAYIAAPPPSLHHFRDRTIGDRQWA